MGSIIVFSILILVNFLGAIINYYFENYKFAMVYSFIVGLCVMGLITTIVML